MLQLTVSDAMNRCCALCCRVWCPPGRAHSRTSGSARNSPGEIHSNTVECCLGGCRCGCIFRNTMKLYHLISRPAAGVGHPETVCGDSLVFPVREVPTAWNHRSGEPPLSLSAPQFVSTPRLSECRPTNRPLPLHSRPKPLSESCCRAACGRPSAKSAPAWRTPCPLSPTGTGPRPGRSSSPCWWRCWSAGMSVLCMGPWGSSQVCSHTDGFSFSSDFKLSYLSYVSFLLCLLNRQINYS